MRVGWIGKAARVVLKVRPAGLSEGKEVKPEVLDYI